MTQKKRTVFTQRSAQRVTLTVKIPADLKQRLDAIQEELHQLAPMLKFDVPEIIEAALVEAVEAAQVELKHLRKQAHKSTGSTESSSVSVNGQLVL